MRKANEARQRSAVVLNGVTIEDDDRDFLSDDEMYEEGTLIRESDLDIFSELNDVEV